MAASRALQVLDKDLREADKAGRSKDGDADVDATAILEEVAGRGGGAFGLEGGAGAAACRGFDVTAKGFRLDGIGGGPLLAGTSGLEAALADVPMLRPPRSSARSV